jgi:Fur family ferric uptake transcriptional regulator
MTTGVGDRRCGRPGGAVADPTAPTDPSPGGSTRRLGCTAVRRELLIPSIIRPMTGLTESPSGSAQPDALVGALAGRGLRLTAARRDLVGLVARFPGHFTAGELAAAARREGIAVGRATVFRLLELLVGLGLVERLELQDGRHAYVRCRPRHHHHVICEACGRSVDVDEIGLAAVVTAVEAQTGFAITDHRLELFGRCPACRHQGEGREGR